MKYLRLVLVLFFVAVLAAVVLYGRGAFRVAVGYSAKQLCSGVFVAGLPESFVLDNDIGPRMALLGPARGALRVEADHSRGLARASFLGVSAQAVYRGAEGCALHGTTLGDSDLVPLADTPEADELPTILTDAFENAFAEPAGGGRNTLALIVAHGGQRWEQYREPVTPATPMQGWSMNKSLMATWVGMQAQRGALDPTRPAVSLAPGLPETSPTSRGGLDPRLTLLHLLQMESGLEFEEKYGPASDVTRMLYDARAMWTVPVEVGMAVAPGQRFAYSSGDTVLASYLWQQSLDRPYSDWIRDEFTMPLGLTALVAEADASGVQVGSSYAYLTARDWLRVGQLWLDAWHGRSPLLSQEWLRASVRARDSDPRGRYGRGFWLNTKGVAFDGLPHNLFYASGNSGQYVVVIPEWELVVVRLGLTQPGVDSGTAEFLHRIAALRPQLAAMAAEAAP